MTNINNKYFTPEDIEARKAITETILSEARCLAAKYGRDIVRFALWDADREFNREVLPVHPIPAPHTLQEAEPCSVQ